MNTRLAAIDLPAILAGILAILLAAPAGACSGDCNGDDEVSVGELVTGVNLALERLPLAECLRFDHDRDGSVGIGEVVAGVDAALHGCPAIDEIQFRRILRTRSSRFDNLPEYPFEPHYVQVGQVRIHYLDEGPPDAEPVLLLHGEPSWSYLYRKMIPPLVAAGFRVIAPDLVGFGRSDKPADREDHTYKRHVEWMRQVVEQLDLRHITLFCHDWGGLIGLRLAAEDGERFDRIVAANTLFPTGDEPPRAALLAWINFSQTVPVFPVGMLIQGSTVTTLDEEVVAAYDAPFPSEEYQAAAREMPALVPITPDDPASPANRRAWQALRGWNKPFLTAFSDGDPITGGEDVVFQTLVPGASGQPHTTITDAGHFLQEDAAEDLASIIISFIESTRESL